MCALLHCSLSHLFVDVLVLSLKRTVFSLFPVTIIWHSGCFGITSLPSTVLPARKLARFTTLMSGRSVSTLNTSSEWHQEWLLSFQATTPLWTLSAHTEAVTGISMSPHCPGVVSTVSQDKMLKVYCNLSSSCISGHHHHPKILISCLQHFLRSGTSRGPSQPLLVSAPLVLAPFTPLTTVLMCPSSLQLEETKPVTISRYDCFFQNCRVCSDHT